MHHTLRDAFHLRSRTAEISLLAASVVFLITTFASADFYQTLGLPSDLAIVVLGLASALAFIFSLALLLMDWRGEAARHGDAAKRWSEVLGLFRDTRSDNGDWPDNRGEELSAAYADAARNSVVIPDNKFNSLKVRYLLKVEISKLAQTFPGAPRFLLWIVVRVRGSYAVIRSGKED